MVTVLYSAILPDIYIIIFYGCCTVQCHPPRHLYHNILWLLYSVQCHPFRHLYQNILWLLHCTLYSAILPDIYIIIFYGYSTVASPSIVTHLIWNTVASCYRYTYLSYSGFLLQIYLSYSGFLLQIYLSYSGFLLQIYLSYSGFFFLYRYKAYRDR